MIKLAKKYGRYGYRMIAQLLRVEGWVVVDMPLLERHFL